MNRNRTQPKYSFYFFRHPDTRVRTPGLIFIFTLVAWVLSSCAPVIGSAQTDLMEWIPLAPRGSAGQSFVANFDGLSGIRLSLSPQSSGTGKINLHLRTDAQSTEDLAFSSMPVAEITAAGEYDFFFDPLNASRRKYYYVLININGEGSVQLGSAAGETYLEGARYLNNTAQDGQLAFRLLYSTRWLSLGLLREFGAWIAVLLAGSFLFLLPGWGLLKIGLPGWGFRPDVPSLTWLEKLGLSAGASLAIYPILLLWTGLVGLRLGPIYAWLPPLAGAGILLWYSRTKFLPRSRRSQNQPPQNSSMRRGFPWGVRWPFPSIHHIGLTAIILLIIFTRFWAVRTLDAPMWGDSYQHTLIAQRIVENNGLFQSWQPYAELRTFTYHFGFHSAVAVFHWITGLSEPRSVLWVGQIINVLAVLCLYPLAMKVCRNRWSGVTALVVAGFLAPVPMSYTNWGRYPQLAGQIILVTVLYAIWTIAQRASRGNTTTLRIQAPVAGSETDKQPADRGFRMVILAAIWIGGLALTHFRVLIFALVFVAAILIHGGLSRLARREWKTLALSIFWIGLGGGTIFLPWFINSFAGTILRNLSNQLTTPASAVPVDIQSYNTVGALTQYMPVGLWLLLPVAAAWGLWKLHAGIRLVCIWGFLLFLAANPAWLRLPGTGALSNFAIFIALYIPGSLILGGAVGLFAESYLSTEWRADLSLKLANGWRANLLRLGVVGMHKNSRLIQGMQVFMALVLIFACLAGIPQQLKELHPERYALLTRPDLRAAYWIQDHLDPGAGLLVNSFFAYGGSLIVGSDGGWWLPLLANRHTTLPPLNYGTEKGFQADYKKQVNELARIIAQKGPADPESLAMLRGRKITHIYIGQRQGRVNYAGPDVLDPNQLSADPHFRVVYHQDRVWIFEIAQTP